MRPHPCPNCDCGADIGADSHTDIGANAEPDSIAPPDTVSDGFTITYPGPFTTFTYTYRYSEPDTSDD